VVPPPRQAGAVPVSRNRERLDMPVAIAVTIEARAPRDSSGGALLSPTRISVTPVSQVSGIPFGADEVVSIS
jgi:hypothetical protein